MTARIFHITTKAHCLKFAVGFGRFFRLKRIAGGNHMGPSMVQLCVNHIGIVLSAYTMFLNAMEKKYPRRRKATGCAAALATGIATGCVYDSLPVICVVFMLILFYIIMGAVYKIRSGKNLALTLVSFGISYALYYAAIFTLVFLLYLNKKAVSGRFEKSVDAWIYILHYVTDFRGGIITSIYIFAVQYSLLVLLMRIRRIKTELIETVNAGRNEILVFLWFVILSVRGIYMFSILTRRDINAVLIICTFLLSLLFFMFYFWYKKELKLLYVTMIQENELDLLEKSIDSKEELIRGLRADNECLAKIIHRDNKLIPSVMMSVRNAEADSESACALNEIYSERSAALLKYESHGRQIYNSGIDEVDAVLLYLADRAASMGVNFEVIIPEDISKIPDIITPSELNAILAVLCEYAMTSSRDRENGAVCVNIDRSGDGFFIEVSDNGEKFDMKALKAIGKKRRFAKRKVRDESNGLIPLFTVLRHTGSSLTIDEFPQNKKYVKSLRVTSGNK